MSLAVSKAQKNIPPPKPSLKDSVGKGAGCGGGCAGGAPKPGGTTMFARGGAACKCCGGCGAPP